MGKFKHIGIVTWHYYSNFGSALQSYALQEAIKQLGNEDVEFVNYHNPRFGRFNKLKNIAKIIIGSTLGSFFEDLRFGQYIFAHKYLNQGQPTTDINRLPYITQNLDIIVCGSDQIWAPNCYDPVYFASFANNNVRKISYAASIGLNNIPEDLVPKYIEHLNSFYAISVREEGGKELLQKKCNINSTVVLDPTLLHRVQFYIKLQRRVKGIKGRFIFCYFLNKEHNYEIRVRDYAQRHNLQIVGVSANDQDSKWMHTLYHLGADQFIWLINNAEVVMTDSYHGTIFSLLFHKIFWTFVRFTEDNPICQNSRIRQLQNYFGLQNRIVGFNETLVEDMPYDYERFEIKLNELREQSFQFLIKALD